MDITERKITKIARETEKLVLLSLREEGVGTAEIDLIHALRHHPGCTQAALAELLHADKAAIARRTKNLEAKGFLVRQDDPNDRRSQLLYPTGKAGAIPPSRFATYIDRPETVCYNKVYRHSVGISTGSIPPTLLLNGGKHIQWQITGASA